MHVDTVIEICSLEYLQWAEGILEKARDRQQWPAEVIHWIFIAQSHDNIIFREKVQLTLS